MESDSLEKANGDNITGKTDIHHVEKLDKHGLPLVPQPSV
jgi:hypothetical protein